MTEAFEKLRPLRNQREINQEYLLKEITNHRREAEYDADSGAHQPVIGAHPVAKIVSELVRLATVFHLPPELSRKRI